MRRLSGMHSLCVFLLPVACFAQLHGFLLVGDLDTNSVMRFSSTGEFMGEFVKRNSGGLRGPGGMALWTPAQVSANTVASNATRAGGSLYVASTLTDQVLQYHGINGRFERQFAQVEAPQDLVFHEGVSYVSSTRLDSIMRFRAATGSPLGYLAKGGFLEGPRGLLLKGSKLLVASFRTSQILEYMPNKAWNCKLTQSPCSSLPRTFNLKAIGPLTSISFGGDRIYAVGPRLGALFQVNSTTGAHVGRYEDPALTAAGGPMDVAFQDGHLFVSVAGKILRFDALTGKSFGTFASQPGVMSRPNRLLWH